MALVRLFIFISFLAIAGLLQAAQIPPPEDPDLRLPNGKIQKDEILKADHERSLKDAAVLVKLTEELKIELERNDRHVLSVASLKKLEDIEKLTKRIRSRLKRY
ncbi:MAG: hypothetical protein WKF37_22880 [Bryobacteraceae bacterium]